MVQVINDDIKTRYDDGEYPLILLLTRSILILKHLYVSLSGFLYPGNKVSCYVIFVYVIESKCATVDLSLQHTLRIC